MHSFFCDFYIFFVYAASTAFHSCCVKYVYWLFFFTFEVFCTSSSQPKYLGEVWAPSR